MLLFPHIFLVQPHSSPCGSGCFSGFVFFPSSFLYFRVCLFSLFIVGTLLVVQYLRFSLLPALWRAARLVGVVCWRCGALGQWVALMDDLFFLVFVQCVARRALSGFCACFVPSVGCPQGNRLWKISSSNLQDEAPTSLPVVVPLFISLLLFHLSRVLLGAWRFGLFRCVYSSFHNRLDLISELAFYWVLYFSFPIYLCLFHHS